jgi:hypothetical protein
MNIKEIKKHISRLVYLLSLPDVDVCWSSYDNALDAIEELKLLESRIISQDKNAVKRLLFLLAPTGALQEISISSGWGDEFLDIAEKIEEILNKQSRFTKARDE